MKKILVVILFQIHFLYGQSLKNGKFYCKMDTSDHYFTEEWTLTLLEINRVELNSVKTKKITKEGKFHLQKMKVQFYTGYWDQKGDSILIGLDCNSDSLKIYGNYELIFLLKENNLVLLRGLQLKSLDYSDIFYRNSVWKKLHFRQRGKGTIRAKF